MILSVVFELYTYTYTHTVCCVHIYFKTCA